MRVEPVSRVTNEYGLCKICGKKIYSGSICKDCADRVRKLQNSRPVKDPQGRGKFIDVRV